MQDVQRWQALEDLLPHLRRRLDGALLVVEGRRDREALQWLGLDDIVLVHQGKSLADVADLLAAQAHGGVVALLLDQDRAGKRLQRQLVNLLAGRAKPDLTAAKELFRLVHSRCVEDIPAELVGLRRRFGEKPTT
ncbi:MAG: hypothetical protein ACPHID_07985 [Thermoplasmatota archaeon]